MSTATVGLTILKNEAQEIHCWACRLCMFNIEGRVAMQEVILFFVAQSDVHNESKGNIYILGPFSREELEKLKFHVEVLVKK